MTINWKIGFSALGGLAAFVMLGLNSRAEIDQFAADDLELRPLYCSVVDPMSAPGL